MKCFNLSISGPAEHVLAAGIPVWTESDRPSIIVGRTYEVGNIFETLTRVKGDLVPLTDALIHAPAATNVGRLIEARYLDSDGGSVDVADGENQSVLVKVCINGYARLEYRQTVADAAEDFSILREADATLSGAYFTDQAKAFLLELKPGSEVTFTYYKYRKVVSTVQGDKWWQLSRWFPYENSSWVIGGHDIKLAYDGKTVTCRPDSSTGEAS